MFFISCLGSHCDGTQFYFWVNYSFNGNIRTCSLIISHILHIYVHRRSSHSEFLTNSQQVHVHRNVFLSSFIIVDESGLFSMRAGVSTTSNLPKTRPRHVHIKAFHSKPILKKKLYLQMYKASCIFSCHFFSRNNKVLFHFNTFHKLQYWHLLKMFWIITKTNINAAYYADVSQEQISARWCLLQSHYIYSVALKSKTTGKQKPI